MSVVSKGQSVARDIVNYVLDKGISGVPPLSSATNLAGEYLLDCGYESNDERVSSLIRWETSKNFTSGFLTGLGGIITLPISVPAALGASWVVQARMAGAIAKIYGHDLEDDRVRTFVLLSLAGDSATAAIKDAGVQIGKKLTEKAIMAIPGRVLVEINKQVGFRLITKAGEKGIFNLIKVVPVAGGVVGGSLDALSCRLVGKTAKKLFRRDLSEV
jgi:uncharacterized protein (DUF697 family)